MAHFAGQRIGRRLTPEQPWQLAADPPQQRQLRDRSGRITQQRLPDQCGRRQFCGRNQPPEAIRIDEQPLLAQQLSHPAQIGRRGNRPLHGGLQCLLTRLRHGHEGLVDERQRQCLDQRQRLTKPELPRQSLFVLQKLLPHRIGELRRCRKLAGRQIARMRAQPRHDAPAHRCAMRRHGQGCGTEPAPLHPRHQGASGIEQLEIGQHRTQTVTQQPRPERCNRGFAVAAQPGDLDRQKGRTSSGFDLRLKEIDQALTSQIEQRRMEQIAGVISHFSRRTQLRLEQIAIDAQLPHALKSRAVTEPDCGGQRVVAGMVDRALGHRDRGDHRPRCFAARQIEQAAGGMQRPRLFAKPLAAADLKAAIAWIEGEAQCPRPLTIEHQWRDDIELLEPRLRLAMPQLRRRERHLGIGRRRKQHGAAHLMVGQPGQRPRIERVLPAGLQLGEAPAQQRMDASPLDQAMAFAGNRMPVPLTLPWIVGQGDPPPHCRKVGRKVRLRCKQVGTQGRLFDPLRAVVVTAQCRQHPSHPVRRLEPFTEVTLQDGMGADFDEAASTQSNGTLDTPGELHRLTHVAPPVAGIEPFCAQLFAGHRRDKVHTARTGRYQFCQALAQRLLDRVHSPTVEGVIEVEQPIKDPLGCQLGTEGFKVGQAARERDIAGTVDAGNLHFQSSAKRLDAGFGLRSRQRDGRHAPTALGQPLRGAAGADQPRSLLEVERAGTPGRRDLTDAVSQHQQRLHPTLAQQLGDGHLHRKQQWLGHGGVVESRSLRLQFGPHRETAQRLQNRIHLGQQFDKTGRFAQQSLPHAMPLRAIAGVDKNHSPCFGQSGLDHDFGRLPGLRKLLQQLRQCRGGFGPQRKALRHPLTIPSNGTGQVVVGFSGLFAQQPGVVRRHRPQRLVRAGRQKQRRRCHRLRSMTARQQPQRWLLQQHMGIGAAEAE